MSRSFEQLEGIQAESKKRLNQRLDRYFLLGNLKKRENALYNILNEFGPNIKGPALLFSDVDDFTLESVRRDVITSTLCWGYPSHYTITMMTKFIGSSPTVECNAGNGLWSCLLQLRGINIIATDIQPWDRCFTEVKSLNAMDAVQTCLPNKGCIFTCWPEYTSNYMTEAIQWALDHDLVEKIIYIGEDAGGCTANEALHHLLKERFVEETEIDNPRWAGINDHVHCYRVK